jgi:hypothetical protein
MMKNGVMMAWLFVWRRPAVLFFFCPGWLGVWVDFSGMGSLIGGNGWLWRAEIERGCGRD